VDAKQIKMVWIHNDVLIPEKTVLNRWQKMTLQLRILGDDNATVEGISNLANGPDAIEDIQPRLVNSRRS